MCSHLSYFKYLLQIYTPLAVSRTQNLNRGFEPGSLSFYSCPKMSFVMTMQNIFDHFFAFLVGRSFDQFDDRKSSVVRLPETPDRKRDRNFHQPGSGSSPGHPCQVLPGRSTGKTEPFSFLYSINIHQGDRFH